MWDRRNAGEGSLCLLSGTKIGISKSSMHPDFRGFAHILHSWLEQDTWAIIAGIVGLGSSLLFFAFIPCLLLCVLQLQLGIVSVSIGLVLAWVLVGEKKKEKKQSASKPGSWQHFPKLFFFSLTYCLGSPGLRDQGQFHFLYSSIAMALGAALCPLCGSTTLYSLMYVYWKAS